MACGQPVRDREPALLKLAQAVETSDPQSDASAAADIAFHSAIVEAAGCPTLATAFGQVMSRSLFFLHRDILAPPGTSGHHSHDDLVQELQTDDRDAAEAAIRRHILTGKASNLGDL